MSQIAKTTVDGEGYVAFRGSSLSETELKDIQKEFYRGVFNEKLMHLPFIHIELKCPIFVRLMFGEHGLQTLTKQDNNLQAFIPSVDMINSGKSDVDTDIQQSIEQNTEALLLSPKGYKLDGCDVFISNMCLPISLYNTLVVSGSLHQWLNLCNKDAPTVIKPYLREIKKVLSVEFNHYVSNR